MRFNLRITAEELAALSTSSIDPAPDLGGHQVVIGSGLQVTTYVTAESAQAIADAWARVAAELSERMVAA